MHTPSGWQHFTLGGGGVVVGSNTEEGQEEE